MTTQFKWIKAPSAEIIPGLGRYGDRVGTAVRAVAGFWAQECQAEMRNSAPWEDRTGNARTGLFSAVDEGAKDLVDIYLSHGHTIYYGVFLELAMGKRYAVIMPVLERKLPQLERMLMDIFRD